MSKFPPIDECTDLAFDPGAEQARGFHMLGFREPKWPGAARVGFLGTASVASWVAIAGLVHLILR